MASLVLTGDTSGQVTLAAPAVAGTTTLTLPATTGTVLNDATVGVCRAWATFNGTLTTPITPRASFNVSSVTKTSTGDYTINLTNALTDTNFALLSLAAATAGGKLVASEALSGSRTTTAGRINISVSGGASALADSDYVQVAFFR